jgi:hypothetical protein
MFLLVKANRASGNTWPSLPDHLEAVWQFTRKTWRFDVNGFLFREVKLPGPPKCSAPPDIADMESTAPDQGGLFPLHAGHTVARERGPKENYPMNGFLPNATDPPFPLVLTTCFVLSFGFVVALLIWS